MPRTVGMSDKNRFKINCANSDYLRIYQVNKACRRGKIPIRLLNQLKEVILSRPYAFSRLLWDGA